MTRIRVASAADAEALAHLRWAFRIEAGTPASTDRDAFVEHMRAFVEDVLAPGRPWRAWVAEDGGRLIGCVWVRLVELVPHPNRSRGERPIVYLTNMYVEPGRRDTGLGRALLDAGLAFARERGAGGVVLWPSERSRPFYERAGFAAGAGPMWLELEGD